MGERLFIGFSPEVIETITGTRGKILTNLANIGGIREIFISSHTDPEKSRSMFVANNFEKDRLARGEAIASDFESVNFPDTTISGRPVNQAQDSELDLFRNPGVRVVCVNTAWPKMAVQRWLDTAINHPPNRGRIGIIGLGNIGENVLNSLLSTSAILTRSGVESPLAAVNLCRDPRSDFDGKILEARHISNPGNVEINTFGEPDINEFYKGSDIVLFIVSKGIPQLGSEAAVGDVRMTQFDANLVELRRYIQKAEEAGFKGTFMVVSDPPEHLATAMHKELAERATFGERSENILGNHQIVAEAGVLNLARAEHVVNQSDPQHDGSLLQSFREHGYVFGSHGRLLVANDVREGHFDESLSDSISRETSIQNLRVREQNKLPFTAPGHNLALSIFDLLRGKPLPISIGTDSIVDGTRAALHNIGAFEIHPFADVDPKLVRRARDVHDFIRSTTETSSRKSIDNLMPMRPTAFWANGVITGKALMTRIVPSCSGRDISTWGANIVSKHHFPMAQGSIYLPRGNKKLQSLIEDTMTFLGDEYSYNIASGTHSTGVEREVISNRQLVTGAGVISVKKIPNAQQFPLDLYKTRFPLYLQIDIELADPSATELIKRMEEEGGIVIGFTPRTHLSAPTLHFAFIGERVGVDSEFPCLPLRSSIAGFEKAMNHLGHWQDDILPAIRSRISKGFGLSDNDTPHASQIAPSLRDKVTEEGQNIVKKDPILQRLLDEMGLYGEAPSMYEHIIYVKYTAAQLAAILGIEGKIDKEMVERMAMLHDLGKAVYLRLGHYVNAATIQTQLCEKDGIRPIKEEELGEKSTHWKYGKFKKDLLAGTKIALPENLKVFAPFVDLENATVSPDTEIAQNIMERSDIAREVPHLYENMMKFFNHKNEYKAEELYVLLTELADNLSDYGRLNDLADITKYLGYKEAYALHRYGTTEQIKGAIEEKFRRLREAIAQLYEQSEK